MKRSFFKVFGALSFSLTLVGAPALAPTNVAQSSLPYALAAGDMSKEDLDAYAQSIGYNQHTPDNISEEILKNCQVIYDKYKERGLSNLAAMAGLANNYVESHCDVDAVEVGGVGGFGIFQYSLSSKTAYLDYTSKNGLDPADLDVQMDYWFDVYSGDWVWTEPSFRNNATNTYCQFATKFIDCAKVPDYFVETTDGWKNMDDLYMATYFFMVFLERPATAQHIVADRLIFANYFKDTFTKGDLSVGSTSSDKESTDSESSDSGTTNIRGGGSTPLAEEDLTGFVKEGVIEGGQDVEIKSSKDLSNEEAMILADHQKYQEMKSFSIANFLLVAFTFMGLWVIIYALTLIGASTIDRVSPFRGLLPLVPILTLGKFNLVYSPEDADPSNGQLTYNSLFVRSLGIALVGVLIAVGVVTGLVSSFFMYFF